MSTCPNCKEALKDLRCANSVCKLYSCKVAEKDESGGKLALLRLADEEDCALVPEGIAGKILECLWAGEPTVLSFNLTENNLTLEKINVFESKTKIHDGWGEVDAYGVVTISGYMFDISIKGTESTEEFSIELDEDQYEKLKAS